MVVGNYLTMFACYLCIIVAVIISHQDLVNAIIDVDLRECSNVYSGAGGLINSPNYPSEYPNNLACSWSIKAPYDSRIRLNFIKFKLEESSICGDKLIVKDGIHADSPILKTYCGSEGEGVTLVSSGNTLRLNFITDSTFGGEGVRIAWEAIPKVLLKEPTEKLFIHHGWKGIQAPAKIISFAPGLRPGTIWAIDSNNEVYFYDGNKWNLQVGTKLQSITVGESGIYGMHPNKSIFWRPGANLRNPEGSNWKFLSANRRNIVQLESGINGILYGVDDRGNIYHVDIKYLADLDYKWGLVGLELESGGEITGANLRISCGMYSCFVTTNTAVYGMVKPGEPRYAKWIKDIGNFKSISAGFGDNVWAIDRAGFVHQKNAVNSIQMLGSGWDLKEGFELKDIVAGPTGVYGLTKDGSLGYLPDAICGGYLLESSGSFSSPNYPLNYPPNKSCLWVVRPEDAKVIELNFSPDFDIRDSPVCKDYLATTYPGITEPIVECGKSIVDKLVDANQVWVEFVSDDSVEGKGFRIDYKSMQTAMKSTKSPMRTAEPPTAGPGKKVTESPKECGNTFASSRGSIQSPNFPNVYDNYLNCNYYIRLQPGMKITLKFKQFSVEGGNGCEFDYLSIFNVNKDGSREFVKKVCGSAKIADFQSEGNQLDLVFTSNYKHRYQGFSIDYMDSDLAKTPTYPKGWREASPKGIKFVQVDASVDSSGAWAVDSSGVPYFFDPDSFTWNAVNKVSESMTLSPGKFGVYAIDNKGELFFRYGVNPKKRDGRYWDRLTTNSDLLSTLDYGAYGELIAIKRNGDVISRLGITDVRNPAGEKWKTIATGYKSVSVGTYGYWLLSENDDLFFGKYTPSLLIDDDGLLKHPVGGKFKRVSAGFGGNVWAINRDNEVFMRTKVNSLYPMGTGWQKVPGLLLSDIASGYDTVYGITLSGKIVHFSETFCGGIFETPTGTFSSPGFPLFYRPNSNCLYIIRVPGYKQLVTDFVQFRIEKSKECYKDYMLTSRDGLYPSKFPMHKDCGNATQKVHSFVDQGWFEFSSDGDTEDIGYFVEWKAYKTPKVVTTAPITVPKKITSLPTNWLIFNMKTFIPTRYKISTLVPYSKDVIWGITTNNEPFVRVDGYTTVLNDRDIISLATNGVDVFAVDRYRRLLFRTGVTKERPEGTGWKVVEENSPFKKIFGGAGGRFSVLTDAGKLRLCDLKETGTSCLNIADNVKTAAVSNDGTWFIDRYGKLHFGKLRFKDGQFLPVKTDMNIALKDIKVTLTGDVWGLHSNGSVMLRKGVSLLTPHGLSWKVYHIDGEKINAMHDSILIFTKDGRVVKAKDPVKLLPDGWQKLNSEVQTPYKLDVYPNRGNIDVWLLGSTDGRTPYKATYHLADGNEIKFEQQGSTKLRDISVGESGVWGIGYEDSKARFYDSRAQKWILLPNDDKNWESIESGSPLNSVYAVDYENSHLFFRDGISASNPLGTKWVNTDVIVTQVSSGTYTTFVVTDDGSLKSFSQPPTVAELQAWKEESFKSYLNEIDNKLSIGFGGVLTYMDHDGDLVQRDMLLPKDEENDKLWVFTLNRGLGLVDVSAGPVIFGISGSDIIAKKVIPCFGVYQETSKPFTVELPEGTPVSRCSWLVTSSKAASISAQLVQHNIPLSAKCSEGGIFYSTDHQTPILGEFKEYCGAPPFKVEAEGNRLSIHYYRKKPSTSDQFKMQFDVKEKDAVSVCGTTMTDATGQLTSKGYPKKYPNKEDCATVITVGSGERVEVTIIKLDIEFGGSSCDYDYLLFNDGPKSTDPVLGKYCGKKSNVVVTSSGSSLRVFFKSDDSGNDFGYQLSWRTLQPKIKTTAPPVPTTPYSGCGGVLTDENGQFSSPGYPNKYTNKQDCATVIKAAAGKRIHVSIDELDIEFGGTSCDYDYLLFNDGELETDTVLGKFCGKKTNVEVTSSGNSLRVYFKSDDSGTGKGYQLKWKTLEAEVKTTPMTATTPPIVVPGGWDEVRLGRSFTSLISDYKGVIWGIGKDDRKIYSIDKDGTPPTIATPLENVHHVTLGKYSLSKNGAWALAGDNKDIYFFDVSSDDDNPWVKVPTVPKYENAEVVATLFNIYLIMKDGHIFVRQGRTSSDPVGKEWFLLTRGVDVAESTFGLWVLKSDGSLHFRKLGSTRFESVDLPSSDSIKFNIDNDRFDDTNKPDADKYYTKIIAGFGNSLYGIVDGELFIRRGINFKNPYGVRWESTGVKGAKDVIVNNFGVYVLLTDGRLIKREEIVCGGILKSKNGQLNYPEFDSTYPSNEYCLWYVEIDGVDQIRFKQRRFELEISKDCTKDRVSIGVFKNSDLAEDGMTVTSFCDKGLPSDQFTVNGNRAFIEFVSDGSNNYGGFSFDYAGVKKIKDADEECFEDLKGKDGRFTSANYPRSYANDLDCYWKITSPSNTKVTLFFDDLNINAKGKCGDEDFLQIYDGPTSEASIIRTFCQENGPQVITASGNEVLVRFKTDSSKYGRGFSGTWRSAPMSEEQDCGSVYTSLRGSVQSPNFPDVYANNLDCNYYIRLQPGKKIILKFDKFSVESGNECEFDSLKIYNVKDGVREFVKKICGSAKIADFQSEGNHLDLLFTSDAKTKYQGFSIDYMDSNLAKTPVYPAGWEEVSPDGRTFVHVDASVDYTGAWAVDSSGFPYFFDPKLFTWSNVDKLSGSVTLSPGKFGVYAIDEQGELYFRYGVNPKRRDGNYWGKLISNSDLSTLDFGAYGELIAIKRNGDVVSRTGIVDIQNPAGDRWKTIATGYKSVSVGTYGYWLLDKNDDLYFTKYTPSSLIYDKLDLRPVGGKFKKVSAGFGGNVWAINRDNEVFMRTKVNSLSPMGTGWKKIPGLLLSDIASGYDQVYGITLTGKIIHFSDTFCGGIYESPYGTFSSPGFPLFYKPNMNCLYIIRAPGYKQIVTDFVQFKIEESENCYKDYMLTSRDGQFPSKFPVHKDCGNTKGKPHAFGDQAWYEFSSDGDTEDIGYFVEWKAYETPRVITTPHTRVTEIPTTTALKTTSDGIYRKCGGALSGEKGILVSPNYPNNYANNRNCRYAITVAPDKIIRLKFETIDMERSETCRYDYIEVTDSFRYVTKRYCKPGPHNDFISFGRSITLHFTTDGGGARTGFRLSWTAIDPKSIIGTTRAPKSTVPPTTEKIVVDTDCGSVLREYSGYIYHPSYPLHYKNNIDCVWKVVAPKGNIIDLSFQFFNLESSPSCQNDYIAIYEGDQTDTHAVKECGKAKPSSYQSKSNIVSVRMRTNHRITSNGFVILYKRIEQETQVTAAPKKECVSRITGKTEGYITSENYPNAYPNDQDCLHFITVKQGSVINLQFVDFDLEVSPQCVYDYLQVIDGGNIQAKSMGKFCDNLLPSPLTTSGNQLLLRFKSDVRNARKGFKVYWKQTSPSTGKPSPKDYKFKLTGDGGEITSPGYPNAYEINKDFYWHITAEPGKIIEVTFEDMDIESGASCAYDYVLITDGADANAKEIGKYCGFLIKDDPKPIVTTGNKMYIHFHSDKQSTRKGFKLRWKASIKKDLSICQSEYKEATKIPGRVGQMIPRCKDDGSYEKLQCHSSIGSCWCVDTKTGDEIYASRSNRGEREPNCDCVFSATGDSGLITHPSFPQNYKNNKDCIWQITADPGKKVKVTFRGMDIDSRGNCKNDFLRLRDGHLKQDPELGTYCGDDIPNSVITTSNKLLVRFKSDPLVTRKGFRLEWEQVDKEDGCKYYLSGNGGEITHRNYPLNYKLNIDCYWYISVEKDKLIRLTFSEMDIENGEKCRYDFLRIADGRDENAKIMGTYCGTTIPPAIVSSGSNMYIHFKSDDQVAKKGFKLIWNAEPRFGNIIDPATQPPATKVPESTVSRKIQLGDCRFSLEGTGGEITHPSYPNKYSLNKECYWNIIAKKGQQIVITFKEMDIERGNGCPYDYLKFQDTENSSDEYGKYCGTELPKEIVSKTNTLFITFKSDSQVTRDGFKLHWKVRPIPKVPLVIVETDHSKCQKEYKKAITPGLLGQMVPRCKDDGSYEEIQCHSSIGSCWCVNVVTGVEVPGSRKNRGEGEPKCGYCVHKGKRYSHGASFKDDCNTCVCSAKPGSKDGVAACTLMACITDLSKCQKEFEDATKTPGRLGQMIPVCKEDGSYEKMQCHASSGHCWCVDTETGAEIPGSRKNPGEGTPNCDYSKCEKEYKKAVAPGLLGQMVPRCKGDGSYEEIQCHSSIGSCWCVNIATGVEVPGSRKNRGEGEPKCGYCTHNGKRYSNGAFFKDECNTCVCNAKPGSKDGQVGCTLMACNTDLSKCQKEFEDATKTPGRLGQMIPVCKEDGSYDKMQCHASSGHCWCVDTKTGAEISGSRKNPGEGTPNCDLSKCQREYQDATKAPGLLGQMVPRCKDDGSYEKTQCHASIGSCWCVDIKTGVEVPGSRKSPGEGSPDCDAPSDNTYNVSGDEGEITSPGYPNDYEVNQDFYWYITVEKGKNIEVTFEDRELEPSSPCSKDFIRIADGPDDSDKEIGKYCGYLITVKGQDPEPIVSSGNTMYIHFHSDNEINRRGFKLKWKAASPLYKKVLLKCQREYKEATKIPGRVGQMIPRCKDDGSYEEMQCHGSVGSCWCVDSTTGVEVPGSRKNRGEGTPNCGGNVCSLPSEVGNCKARIEKFFYNHKSGRCEKFFYGGCKGNGNNFDSLVQCIRTCGGFSIGTKPPFTKVNICHIPAKVGPCKGRIEKFFFNPGSGRCEKFNYGGCLGNENRFDSIVECVRACGGNPLGTLPPLKINICHLPSVVGPCQALIEKFFFNRESGKCEKFFYGGCRGNENNFGSLAECASRCGGSPGGTTPPLPSVCSLPSKIGNCRASIEKFFYNHKSGRCEKFFYGGCGGNGNNFDSLVKCIRTCGGFSIGTKPPFTSVNICHIPAKVGPCKARIEKFFFNPGSGRCEKFNYGGCLGNENRFDSIVECVRACGGKNLGTLPPIKLNFCHLPKEVGPCQAQIEKFFFNRESGKCEKFFYGGCRGNENNFDSIVDCARKCGGFPGGTTPPLTSVNICNLPVKVGPCKARQEKFFFNRESGKCEKFFYGGCLGNSNNFDTIVECARKCGGFPGGTTPPLTSVNICHLPVKVGPCEARKEKFFFNRESGKCEKFFYGGCSGNSNNFDTIVECARTCGGFPGGTTPPLTSVNICNLPVKVGPCKARQEKFFFNRKSGKCEKFFYGGCLGNSNNFDTIVDCARKCGGFPGGTTPPLTSVNICHLPAQAGPCKARKEKFFYNKESGKCEKFIYGGCLGNSNNFESFEECSGKCGQKPKCDRVCPDNLNPVCGSNGKTYPNKCSFKAERECKILRIKVLHKGRCIDAPKNVFKLSGEEGEIISPGYPNDYEVNQDYFYHITVEKGKKVEVAFEDRELEPSANCANDFIRIAGGPGGSDTEIGKYCGYLINIQGQDPEPIISSDNKMYIHFHSDDQITGKGFKLRWKTTDRVIEKDNPDLSKCQSEYKEATKNGGLLGQMVPRCKEDGSYEKTQCHSSVGSCWCVDTKTGTEIPGSRKNRGEGSPNCDATSDNTFNLSGDKGAITSPGYPSDYEVNQDFYWHINVEKGKKVEVTFEDRELEPSTSCEKDFIRIADGPNDSDKEIGKYCGYLITVKDQDPEPIVSSGNKMYIHFHSDKDFTRRGFKLRWKAADPPIKKDQSKCQKEYEAATKTPGLLGQMVPRCKDDGSYEKTQCHASVGSCWCVDTKTGLEVPGSRKNRGEGAPTCDETKCQREYREATKIDGPAGKMALRCQADGSYEKTQCSASHCWCVDAETGIEIPGTRKTPGEGSPTCDESKCQREYKDATKIPGRVGQMVPSCTDDGGYEKMQCHGSIGSCWCVDTNSGSEILGSRKNRGEGSPNCDLSVCQHEYAFASKPERKGEFIPKCKANGLYEKIQCHGSPGHCWCVVETTGKEIDGTRRGPGETPNCDPAVGVGPVYRSNHLLAGAKGAFSHPGYPSNYENNVDSTWLITTEHDNIINLNFDMFNLQSDPNCLYDYVDVYDGKTQKDKLIGRFCNSNPEKIKSTGYEMLIHFHSDGDKTSPGFLANWNAEKSLTSTNQYDICSNSRINYEGNPIELHSPKYLSGGLYPPNKDCVIMLTYEPGTVFQIEFIDLNMQVPDTNDNKCKDFISIRDGDQTAEELVRYCGREAAKRKFRTTDNMVFIEFITDDYIEERGFHIHISSTKKPQTEAGLFAGSQCGKQITGQRGTITNPTSLSESFDSSVCIWQVATTAGSQMSLMFDIIDLPGGCDLSYVLLREGDNSNSPLIQKFCGFNKELQFSTKSNRLWVEYKTPHKNIGQFVMRWLEKGGSDIHCGGTVTGKNGYLTTPFYPKAIDDDVFCLWIIMVDPKKKVTLTFQDTRIGSNCAQSYSIVRDGMTSDSKLLGRYCGNTNAPPVVSTKNYLWVELKGSCVTGKAFKAFWGATDSGAFPDLKEVTNEKSPGLFEGGIALAENGKRSKGTARNEVIHTMTYSVKEVSGATWITGTNGTIVSPFFPENYPHDHIKVWVLVGPEQSKIEIQFTSFSLESDSHCLYDYVEIRDGSMARSRKIGRYCGNVIPRILKSTGNKMWVKFRSDSSSHEAGFSANWKAISHDNNNLPLPTVKSVNSTACGGLFISSTGSITSPSFPDYYPSNSECIYIISPPNAKRIRLEFDSFDIEAHRMCSFDFLEVKEGITGEGALLKRLCKSVLPKPIDSNVGAMWIRFKSDRSTNRPGFSASWAVLESRT